MPLKFNEQGQVVLNEAKLPIFIHADGTEAPLDVDSTVARISVLNNESAAHRNEAKKFKEALEKFAGIEDPAAALKALDTMKSLDQKKLIDAGEVDIVKRQVSEAYDKKLADKDVEIQNKDKHIYKLEVSNRFTASPFVTEKLILPPDIAETYFGQNFKVEDGTVVGYLNGQKCYSKERPGELANFEEAIEMMVQTYPQRDKILKGKASSGFDSKDSSKGHKQDTGNLTSTEKIAAGLKQLGG